MTIPDYQAIMLPLLKLAADGLDHKLSVSIEVIAEEFGLTPEERRVMLPSGSQATLANRVGWARTYMTKAGLLNSAQRGVFNITQRGRDLLAREPERIDGSVLRQFPEFLEFQRASPAKRETLDDTSMVAILPRQTPEETIERGVQELHETLAQELLARLKGLDPLAFEKLVLRLLLAMGYGDLRPDAGHHTGKSGDQGIDGLINEDELGLDVVYIQAKKWENPVGGPEVRAFAGSLAGQHANKGVLITTSSFTSDARDFVRVVGQRIVLIDGGRLAQLMIKHDLAVTTIATYAIKQVDSDYLEAL